MIANRAPGRTWGLRIADVNPTYVSTGPDETIEIYSYATGRLTVFSRKDARLLARRINQCLDGTRLGNAEKESA